MEFRPLGRTGVSVSPLCLGTMMFGPWGNDDRADSVRVIHHALNAGINFVDTADVYSGGVYMSTAANRRKLDVVEDLALLAEASGITMIELALGWAISHPGVTSAIIGPRTMEQLESQLPGADMTLSAEILDRIDELVAPGVTINDDDNSYGAAELTPEARRR